MIKFIETQQVLAIRNEVLREGKLALDDCRFKGDEDEGTFHLGYFYDDELVCIASFHPQKISADLYKLDDSKRGYQLRGMATLPAYQKKGFGNQLINFSIVYLRGKKVNYLWCNARKVAFRFYQNLGFEFVSDEFIIPGIGTHKAMYLKIQ